MAERLAFLPALLAPGAAALVVAVIADLSIGDPVYSWHPVRLLGRTLGWMEAGLRRLRLDGYVGGVLLFLGLTAVAVVAVSVAITLAGLISNESGWIAHVFLLYSLLALGDLLHHVRQIETAVLANNLTSARAVVSMLVGRDTDRLDAAGCRRAAVESLSENLTDGFVSPLFWYLIAGLPGLVIFKVVSTMDSMVGYKTPRYLRFGWCGARLDDLMNYIPARLTGLAIVLVAMVLPSCSGLKAWRVGRGQHGLLPGPNSGWSEAAIAGAIQRRIVGPIWLNGVQVTGLWLGDPADPPLETHHDVARATMTATMTGLVVSAAGALLLYLR